LIRGVPEPIIRADSPRRASGALLVIAPGDCMIPSRLIARSATRRRTVALSTMLPVAAALLLGACSDTTAPQAEPGEMRAITGGAPATDARYDAVGGVVFDANGDGKASGFEVFCSGVLVAPGTFITAAHCVLGAEENTRVRLTFAADVRTPAATVPISSIQIDPRYLRTGGRLGDLAVVRVNPDHTAGITPIMLAPEGGLDELSRAGALRGATFLAVGYGAQASLTGRPAFDYPDVRQVASAPFMSLNGTYLGVFINTRVTGLGGDCFGDSGGPKLLEQHGELRVYALVTKGDVVCRATSFNTRVDTRESQAFLLNP
jgi:hypothetical protein